MFGPSWRNKRAALGILSSGCVVSLLAVGLQIVPGGAGEFFSLPERRQGRPHRAGAVPGPGDARSP